MTPALTFRTPAQPPSTETISTLFSRPAALSAREAPAAAGSLMVYTTLISGALWRQFSIAVWALA
jgi:hypothetical protein